MARIVVPINRIMVIKPTFISVTRNDDAEISLWARLDGGIWRNRTPVNLFQTSPQMGVKYTFPELAEVEYRGHALVGSANMSAAFGYKFFVVTDQQQQDAAAAEARAYGG